jgi:hypothetical protein
VFADPDRILEVLINLIDNAIKFTPADGAITVKACMVESDPEMVYLAVTDTGRGIGPEAKAQIFERLYQDPDAIDSSRSGLGLGLFICRELVKLHQGRIWVTSEQGQGSTFSFTLPIYSLTKLLFPVVTHQESMRTAFSLVQVELQPLSNPPRGNWRETWKECMETLRRCVYLDKDLVLPSMGMAGPAETFFVVASTDMERAGIMAMRIRDQLERIASLKSVGKLSIMTVPIVPSASSPGETLEQQVQHLADRVNEIVLRAIGKEHSPAASSLPGSSRQLHQ